jgi:UDP-N-acetylglucosamine 2-epimerase (non-hydrolysing)
MKTIITITGIRPDFIRMSEIFKKLDKNFNHILIHSGQHYDKLLSDVFFSELDIRQPDYNLGIGGPNKEHFHQAGELSVKLIELIREKNLEPDLIIFLGDSNSVVCSVALKKEGYKIGHIEAGMRSGDKRMLEEINRMVCDTCSDFLFVYHKNYMKKLEKENIKENVYVVGNTIVEVAQKIKFSTPPKNDFIILDIHRPENFKYSDRLQNIISYANTIGKVYGLTVKMLGFNRTLKAISEFKLYLDNIEVVDLMPFKEYITNVYNAKFIISDSGTAQEEPALFNTPVIVPRDFTERPESITHNCSFMVNMNNTTNETIDESLKWLSKHFNGSIKIDSSWLGDGKTSDKIIKILNDKL